MNGKQIILSVYTLCTVFMFVLFSAGAGASAPDDSDSCGCHSNKYVQRFTHLPVKKKECLSCHKPTGEKHPRIKKGAFSLTDDGKVGLCNECHERKDTKKFVHGPIGSGDCLACHDAHQSDFKSQTKASGGNLCFMCHDKKKYERAYPHPPIAEGKCLGCHDPHQSDSKFLLRGEGVKLCILCHNQGMFTGRSVHGPVADGQCGACHATHGTQYPHLLRQNFSNDFYMPFDKANFALCFSCHKNTLADEYLTSTLTNFRNGMVNIHYIHINKPEKGRSCKVCHDPHASKQQRLISSSIAGFGRWGIPIRFTKTDTGGTCIVGCHKPKSYDRANPVVNP